MKHTYSVIGMSCTGCKASVESALLALDAVSHVSVNLNESEATVEMTRHLSVDELQEALTNAGLSN